MHLVYARRGFSGPDVSIAGHSVARMCIEVILFKTRMKSLYTHVLDNMRLERLGQMLENSLPIDVHAKFAPLADASKPAPASGAPGPNTMGPTPQAAPGNVPPTGGSARPPAAATKNIFSQAV